MQNSIKDEILQLLDGLDADQQRKVLEFTQGLQGKRGIPGPVFLERAKRHQFDPDDLELMRQAIEAECERIDWSGWE